MAGITADISTSSFKPLSLDEIMMVPLAKQKMEDDFIAKSDKFNELQASTAKVDQEKATGILEGFKGRASKLSENIMERGVSRSEFNKLRGLKNEVQTEYGNEGFLGRSVANQKAMVLFENDLATKKERQSGFSPAEAQQWARMEIKKFNEGAGSQNNDGTFNTFQGVEMDSQIDELQWMKDNVADIQADILPESLAILKQGFPAFKQALMQGTLEKVDYNTVIDHLSRQASTDVNLQKSLLQRAKLSGLENIEDALDFGKFEMVSEENDAGEEITRKVWKTGKARFGEKMSGMSSASSYIKRTSNATLFTDEVGKRLSEMNMDEGQVTKMVNFSNSDLKNIGSRTIKELTKNLENATAITDEMYSNVLRTKNELLDGDEEYQKLKTQLESKNVPEELRQGLQKKAKERSSVILSGNKNYVDKEKQYVRSTVKFRNAKHAIEALNTTTIKEMTPDQVEGYKASEDLKNNVPGYYNKKEPRNQAERIQSLENAIRGLPGGEDLIPEVGGMNQVTVGAEEVENFLVSKYLELKGYEVNKTARADRNLFNWSGSEDLSYDPDLIERAKNSDNKYEEVMTSAIAADPQANVYQIITADKIGGINSSVVSKNNEALKIGLQVKSMEVSYTGELVNDEYIASLIGESTEGYDYTPQMTDSWDQNGNKIVNITAKNLQSGVVTSFGIVDNSNRTNDIEVAKVLIRSGSPDQVKAGQRIMRGYKYMPRVKQSNMSFQNEGIIGELPFRSKETGKPLEVTWKKSEDKTYFTASIGDMPLNNGQAIFGEIDMVNVIAKYVDMRYQKKAEADAKKDEDARLKKLEEAKK
jgi:hypothetical protein